LKEKWREYLISENSQNLLDGIVYLFSQNINQSCSVSTLEMIFDHPPLFVGQVSQGSLFYFYFYFILFIFFRFNYHFSRQKNLNADSLINFLTSSSSSGSCYIKALITLVIDNRIFETILDSPFIDTLIKMMNILSQYKGFSVHFVSFIFFFFCRFI
jgi:hypothetical protein